MKEFPEARVLRWDRDVTRGRRYQAKPYPDFMLELIRAGGLIEYTKRRLATT